MGSKQNDSGAGNEAFREQALRVSELNYRRLFESAQDGILITEDDPRDLQLTMSALEEYSMANIVSAKKNRFE
jgi:hypothetical protein